MGVAETEHHLRMMRLAEEFGFDGVALNEHHNTMYSMTPAVSVMTGAVVAATSRVRICRDGRGSDRVLDRGCRRKQGQHRPRARGHSHYVAQQMGAQA